jgi:hypothetical protein
MFRHDQSIIPAKPRLGVSTKTRSTVVRTDSATGGHTPALILRADGAAHFCPLGGGQLVGIVPDAHFTRAEFRLVAGDTLLRYTDAPKPTSTPSATGTTRAIRPWRAAA